MGGFNAYPAFSIHIRRISRYGEHGLAVDAQVTFALARKKGQSLKEMQTSYLVRWDRLGYKIGLQIGHDQQIDRLVYRRDGRGEIVMREDAEVTADLTNTFGSSGAARWVGLVPDSPARRRFRFIEPNVIAFNMTLTLSPVLHLPQLVPVAVRHRLGKFEDRHLGTLILLSVPRVETKR